MLKTVLNGITLKNPVIAASGTFGFGQEYDQFFDISRLGGISSKGLTLEERFGNEGERVYETPSGLINSIGLQNPGVDAFIREDLPFLRQKDTAVIANLGGSTIESYLEGVEQLNETDVDMIELNISCPNVKHGGMALGIKCDIAYEAVKQVRAVCKKPLMVKLSPNAENIMEMALRCEEAGSTRSRPWPLISTKENPCLTMCSRDFPARRFCPLPCGWFTRFAARFKSR